MFSSLFGAKRLSRVIERAPPGTEIDMDQAFQAEPEPVTISRSLTLRSRKRASLPVALLISGPCKVQIEGIGRLQHVIVGGGGEVSMTNCEFSGPLPEDRPAVVVIGARSQLSMQNCNFLKLATSGIRVREGAYASITNCVFETIEKTAVLSDDNGTRLEVSKSRFKNIKGNGVWADKGSHAP